MNCRDVACYIPTSLLLVVFLVLVGVSPLTAHAQSATPTPDGIVVTFPMNVALLQGVVAVRGDVTNTNATRYFIQQRRLLDDLTPVGGPDALWSPATLPATSFGTDIILGEWNTTLIEDGIYEIELVVEQSSGPAVRVRVGPVRVANERPPFEGARYSVPVSPTPATSDAASTPPALVEATVPPIAVGGATLPPTLAPSSLTISTSTPTPATVVFITATIQANVRLGDSPSYPAVGFLEVGQTVEALAKSSRSNWIQVELPNGNIGFISPSTVNVDGDLFALDTVTPPPLPFTPTPVPTATPIATANLQVVAFRTEPSTRTCGQTFTIFATIQNTGNGTTNDSTTIAVADRYAATGQIVESTLGVVPQLSAGETYTAIIPITVTAFFNETHRLSVTVDDSNRVIERNEGDNTFTTEYTLARGGC
ncbi:MAG: CARDB domain-containing protein [Chloroflexota bacterium]